MRFTLKQLRYVDAAGRTKSITDAAAQLNISQSSITAAIDALEEVVGFDLFIRTPAKGILPTPTGIDALNYISRFLEQAYHLDSDLKSIGKDPVGILRLACYVTAAPYVLPIMLKGFAQEYPGVRIELVEGDMPAIHDQLLCGRVDVACMFAASLSESLSFTPLFEPPPYAVVGDETDFARQSAVSLVDLVQHPMILLDLPVARDYYLHLFHMHDLEPTIIHSTRSSEIVRALVAGGFGFSILNIRAKDSICPGYVCRPILEVGNPPSFGIAGVTGIRHPRIVRAFLDHCDKLKEANAFAGVIVN